MLLETEKERERGQRTAKETFGKKNHTYLPLFHEKIGLNRNIRCKSKKFIQLASIFLKKI